MSLLTLQAAGFDYGRQTILAAENLTIHIGERYGLVGVNGAGKSTLLRILAGELGVLRGSVQKAARASVGYLPQDTKLESEEPLRQGVRRTAFGGLLDIQRRLEELGVRMSSGEDSPALLEQYGQLHERFEAADGYTMDSRCEAALHGLGFGMDRMDQPMSTLSGGQKRRAALAATLLAAHDLLLLDEPTNHLDLDACEWLESHLKDRNTAVVTISHDRSFLDNATDFTLHILNGKLSRYSGGYTKFLRQWDEHKVAWESQYRRQRDHIERTETFIRKNIAGQRTNQAKSRRKQLANLDRMAAPPSQGRQLSFDLTPSRSSGAVVFEAQGVGMSFGELALFKQLNFEVLRGDKVGILGPNGTGKTTLLKILSRLTIPTSGMVDRGHNVDMGVFDQELSLVSDGNTVFQEMRDLRPDASENEIRTQLGAFHFDADMIDQTVRTLSGGERARLSLLKLILERHNTLLLDEPTNHLDVDTREALESALVGYQGTLIVVSHDRYFLNRICDRVLAFEGEVGGGDSRLRQLLGNYDDYRRVLREERESRSQAIVEPAEAVSLASAALVSNQPRRKSDLSKNELGKLRREAADIEEEITMLEIQLEDLAEQMSGAGGDAAMMQKLATQTADFRGALDKKMQRWEELTTLLERDSES